MGKLGRDVFLTLKKRKKERARRNGCPCGYKKRLSSSKVEEEWTHMAKFKVIDRFKNGTKDGIQALSSIIHAYPHKVCALFLAVLLFVRVDKEKKGAQKNEKREPGFWKQHTS